jgi:hypothetical protein
MEGLLSVASDKDKQKYLQQAISWVFRYAYDLQLNDEMDADKDSLAGWIATSVFRVPCSIRQASSTKGSSSSMKQFCETRGTYLWTTALDAELVRYVTQACRTAEVTPKSLLSSTAGRSVEWATLAPDIDDKSLDFFPLLRTRLRESPKEFARQMEYRFQELCVLNSHVANCLPLVIAASIAKQGLHSPDDGATLLTLVSGARHLLFGAVKQELWDNGLSKTQESGGGQFDLVLRRSLDRSKGPVNYKHTFFGQAFEKMHPMDPAKLRQQRQLWNAVFAGFRSHDAGGPYRESFSLFCSDLQSENLNLLVKTPNQLQNVGSNRGDWIVNPAANDHISLEMFKFLGKLMGIAIRNKEYLPLDISPLVWAKLVGSPITTNLLSHSHYLLVSSLTRFIGYRVADEHSGASSISKSNLDAQTNASASLAPPRLSRLVSKGGSDLQMSVDSFTDILSLDFTHHGLDNKSHDLVHNGSDREVEFKDIAQYSTLRLKFAISEIDAQVNAIRQGLAEIVPARLLFLLRWDELATAVCGLPIVDVELLKKATKHKFDSNTRRAKSFWGAIDMMTNAERSQF